MVIARPVLYIDLPSTTERHAALCSVGRLPTPGLSGIKKNSLSLSAAPSSALSQDTAITPPHSHILRLSITSVQSRQFSMSILHTNRVPEVSDRKPFYISALNISVGTQKPLIKWLSGGRIYHLT